MSGCWTLLRKRLFFGRGIRLKYLLAGINVKALALGGYHTCALTTSGNIWCWGGNSVGQLGIGSTADQYIPVAVSLGSGRDQAKDSPLVLIYCLQESLLSFFTRTIYRWQYRRHHFRKLSYLRPGNQWQALVLGRQQPRPAGNWEHY